MGETHRVERDRGVETEKRQKERQSANDEGGNRGGERWVVTEEHRHKRRDLEKETEGNMHKKTTTKSKLDMDIRVP
jgi:hypothetical protein